MVRLEKLTSNSMVGVLQKWSELLQGTTFLEIS